MLHFLAGALIGASADLTRVQALVGWAGGNFRRSGRKRHAWLALVPRLELVV